MEKPKISVIIPIHNSEKYLKKCLDSITSQAFEDIEIICVDDFSDDNSLNIIKDYAQNDDRFVIIEQEKSAGPGVARNKAIDIARGNYIVFADSDDLLENNALTLIYDKFQKTKAEVIQFNYKKIGNKEKCVKPVKLSKKYLYDENDAPYYTWNMIKGNCLTTQAMVWFRAYSREFLIENNIKFANNSHHEDGIFSIKCLLLADKIYYLNHYLYDYFYRSNSCVNSISDDVFCVFENIDLLKSFLENENYLKVLSNEFSDYKINVMKWHYGSVLPESKNAYIKKCKDYLSVDEYKNFQKSLKKSFLENIFSIKNIKTDGQKSKIVTILGFEIGKTIKSGEA